MSGGQQSSYGKHNVIEINLNEGYIGQLFTQLHLGLVSIYGATRIHSKDLT